METRRTRILILLFCLLSLYCARFRVKTLEASKLFSLDIVSQEDPNLDMKIQVLEKEGIPYNLPTYFAIGRDKVYITDTNRSLVRVFNQSEKQALAILARDKPFQMNKDINFQKLDLNIPGYIAIDAEDEKIYIQSFLEDKSEKLYKATVPEKRKSLQHSYLSQSLSYILILDSKDYKLQGTLGREGYNSDPFYIIMEIYPEEDSVLNVLHKNEINSQVELLVFRKGKLQKKFETPKLPIEYDSKKYLIELEKIQPVNAVEFVIGSIAIRELSNYNLVERIIYKQSHPSQEAQIILRNDSFLDHLIWANKDGDFYLLQVKDYGSDLFFKIFNKNGDYLRNKEIELGGLRSTWHNVSINLKGNIYSSRVLQNKWILYEWK